MRHQIHMSLGLGRRGERAFERIYRRHVADVYRYAFVVLGDEEHAESVTQATFVHAYRAFRDGERPKNSFNWLLGFAHKLCGRRSLGIDAAVPEELLDDEAPPSPADIRRAIDSLGFQERSALLMRELERKSVAEIARFLRLSVPEVEALIFTARRSLRQQLERTLTCHQAERAISRRLDGRLSRSERKSLKAHLKICRECAEFAAVQTRNRAALVAFDEWPLPAGLQAHRGPRWRFRLAPVARLGAVAAVAMVAGGMLVGGTDPREWGQDATRIEPARASIPPELKSEVKQRVEKTKTVRQRRDR